MGNGMRIMKVVRRFYLGILLLVISATALLLSGCASTLQYPPFPDQAKRIEDPAKARVYLMRPGKIWLAGVPLVFYGTDLEATGPVFDPSGKIIIPLFGMFPDNYSKNVRLRRIGEVGPGSYICWETPPHTFSLERVEGDTNSICSMDLQAGNVYYLRGSVHMGWVKSKSIVEILSEDKGQSILKNCKPPDRVTKGTQP
jgi:hypothetical protein